MAVRGPLGGSCALGRGRASVLLALSAAAGAFAAGDPVALRMEHFTVLPSSGPVTHVLVQNLLEGPYRGTIRVELPQGWRPGVVERAVALDPGETKRLSVPIEHAVDVPANRYAITVRATGGGAEVTRTQTVVCVSAPYFKPVIDGESAAWGDAIPVTYVDQGRQTVVRTYWNRRFFYRRQRPLE